MTKTEKLAQLKVLIQQNDNKLDEVLGVYLDLAKTEILSWLYNGKTPVGVTDVPERHETVQIMACVVGFGLSGVENQKSDSELGKNRSFKYEDMTAYIRDRIYPYIEVV